MPPSAVDALDVLSPVRSATAVPAAPAAIEHDVLVLFDRWGPSLLRYVASIGLRPEETEDIVQDVFLALCRHLLLGRSRRNLRGWIFQVAHNQALKQRGVRQRARAVCDEETVALCVDPAANPEAQCEARERRAYLRAVMRVLPERDWRCLCLRAEGLGYRDIAATLDMSLGAVAKILTRTVARLTAADERRRHVR
jgi:RNA polymerase sigma-70 factor (ECF subfamily)